MLNKLSIDYYMLSLLGSIALAGFLPVYGDSARIVSSMSYAAVSLLFFLYGAKLKSNVILAGVANWRLQGLVFIMTYLIFPLLGIILSYLTQAWLPETLRIGFIFLAILPST